MIQGNDWIVLGYHCVARVRLGYRLDAHYFCYFSAWTLTSEGLRSLKA